MKVEDLNDDDSDFCIISLVDDDDKIPKSKRPKLGEATKDQGEGTDIKYVEPDVLMSPKKSAVYEKRNSAAVNDKIIDVYDIDNDTDESVDLPDIKPRKTPQKKNKKTPQKTDSTPGFFVDRTPNRSAKKKTNTDPELHYFIKGLNKSKSQLEGEEEMEIQVIDISKSNTGTPDQASKVIKSPLKKKKGSPVKHVAIESDEEECSVYDAVTADTPAEFFKDRTAKKFVEKVNSSSASERSAAESPVVEYIGSGKNTEHDEDMEIQVVGAQGNLLGSPELSPKKQKPSPKRNSPIKQLPKVDNSTIKQSFKKDNSPVKPSPKLEGSPLKQSPNKINSPLKFSPSPKKVLTSKEIAQGDSSESSSEIDETIISLTKDISNSLKRFKANTSSECSEDVYVESSNASRRVSDEEDSSPRNLTIVVASDSDDSETEALQSKCDKLSRNENVERNQDNLAVSDDESRQDSGEEDNSPKKLSQVVSSNSDDTMVSPAKRCGRDNPQDKTPKPVTEDYISKMITEIRLNVSSAQREETNAQSNIRTRLRTKSESKVESPVSNDLTLIKPKAQEKQTEISLRDWLIKSPKTPDQTSNRQIKTKSEPRQIRHTPSTECKVDVKKQTGGQVFSPEKTKKETPTRTARKTPVSNSNQESFSGKRKSLTQSVPTRNTASPKTSLNSEKTPKMKSTPEGLSGKGPKDTSSGSIQDSLHRRDKSPVQSVDIRTVTPPKPSTIEGSPKIKSTPKRSARNKSELSSADEAHTNQVELKTKSPMKTPVQVELKAKSPIKIPDESHSNHKVKSTRTEDVFGEPLKTYSLKDRASGKKPTTRQATDLNLSTSEPSLKESTDMDSDSSTSTTASNQSALRKTYFLRGSQKGSPQKHLCLTCQPEQACSNTDVSMLLIIML